MLGSGGAVPSNSGASGGALPSNCASGGGGSASSPPLSAPASTGTIGLRQAVSKLGSQPHNSASAAAAMALSRMPDLLAP